MVHAEKSELQVRQPLPRNDCSQPWAVGSNQWEVASPEKLVFRPPAPPRALSSLRMAGCVQGCPLNFQRLLVLFLLPALSCFVCRGSCSI